MHSLCSYVSFHFIKSIAGDGEYFVFRLFNDCSRRHVKVLYIYHLKDFWKDTEINLGFGEESD